MRRLLFLFTALLLLTPALSYADTPVALGPTATLNPDYCAHQATGTATYVLNKATTGTASATIDLGLFGCFFVNASSTAGAPVRVWFTYNSTSYVAGTTLTAGTLWGTLKAGGPNNPSCYAIPKVSRYVYFDTPPSYGVPFAAGGTTPTAITTSVFYSLPTNWPY